MKNLWTVLPPLLADNFGFIEAVNPTDGCGVVDDSGEYRLGGGHGGSHGGHGERGERGGRGGYGERGGHGGHGGRERAEGHRPPWADGGAWSRDGERRPERPRGGKRGGGGNTRVVVSSVASEDVVTGTRSQVLKAFEEAKSRFDPKFALFSAGPCGAMIGTDLEEIAETVVREYGLPAAAVNLTGQKAYDFGLSKTMEAMAKLFAKPMEKEAGTVNLLGCNALDWATADAEQVKAWAERQGFRVLTQLGSKVTAAQLETMAKAQVNLVTTVSGLAAARYLEAEFGTPYVAAAPFGTGNCKRLLEAVETGVQQGVGSQEGPAEALIVGEQFTANAVRAALEEAGIVKSADVATFYTLDKSFARKGDKRIRGEEGAEALLQSGAYRMIVADPLLRCFAPENCKWVDLKHWAFNTYGEQNDAPSLAAGNLDAWLNKNL